MGKNTRKSFIMVELVNHSEDILRQPEEIFKAKNNISAVREVEGRRYIFSKIRRRILYLESLLSLNQF